MATLSVLFTPPGTPPANGYRVRYWLASNPSNVFTVSPNPTSSPVTITGLTGTSYQGTIEADCGGGLYSSLNNFSADTIIGDPCLSGNVTAVTNCSGGETKTFTLATGNSVNVSLHGFIYSSLGMTNTISGRLLTGSNALVQEFTYTQPGAGAGYTTPSFYTLTNISGSAVSYKIQIDPIVCSHFKDSAEGNITVSGCLPTNPSVVVNNATFSGLTISAVTVNSVAVTYETGVNLPIAYSGLGYFRTTQVGTFNIAVSYSNPAVSSPRAIRVTGSNGVSQTQTSQATNATLTFSNVVVNTSQSVQIAIVQS
jgi:hypothetical protein